MSTSPVYNIKHEHSRFPACRPLTSSTAFKNPECAPNARKPLDRTRSTFGPAESGACDTLRIDRITRGRSTSSCRCLMITLADILDQILHASSNICKRMLSSPPRHSSGWFGYRRSNFAPWKALLLSWWRNDSRRQSRCDHGGAACSPQLKVSKIRHAALLTPAG